MSARDDLLLRLQQGLSIEHRPFASLAKKAGVSEDEAIATVQRMLADGSARRFGAVFDARRLGYRSVLCAVDVPEGDIDRIGARVALHPGVTHCYERASPPASATVADPGAERDRLPNLWFTLAVPAPAFENGVAQLRDAAAPYVLRLLPALRRFKIDVIFDSAERERGESVPGSDLATLQTPDDNEVWSEREKELVRALAGDVPVCADCYARIAESLGWTEEALLTTLTEWKRRGALRRIALIVRHRRIGFTANAMCVWRVDETRIVEAGRRVAAWPQVTHCYQRERLPGWPYNLFAMIHAGDWLSLRRLFDRIAESADLADGRMLGSLREFKKTSMRYFEE